MASYESGDFGKVKFQNAFEYYELMYALYKRVLETSNAASQLTYQTMQKYYDSLEELYYFIEPFIEQQTKEFVYGAALASIIKNSSLKTKELGLKLNLPVKEVKFIQDKYGKLETKSISGYFGSVRDRLVETKLYMNAKMELEKRLRVIKGMLDDIKRTLAYEMKQNKLTVPIMNFDPRMAITRGFH